jgi:hypothetical protein
LSRHHSQTHPVSDEPSDIPPGENVFASPADMKLDMVNCSALQGVATSNKFPQDKPSGHIPRKHNIIAYELIHFEEMELKIAI